MNFCFNGVEKLYSNPPKDYLDTKYNVYQNFLTDPEYGFLKMESVFEQSIPLCENLVQKFKDKTCFVQIGIGGSSLGPEMLISSLKQNSRKFVFLNNVDPDYLFEQLADLDWNSTLFYVVSKTGSTVETMANFSIIANELTKNNIQKENFKDYFVFATDPNGGSLREIGNEFNISMLDIPPSIGGRYSVLTPVGLLPAAFADINLRELASGYAHAKHALEENGASDPLFKLSYYLESAHGENIDQTVFMPYSSKLRNFSDWFVQLWAESLGKKENLAGKIVNTGLTPIASYGATDQHSQMQLFMEGPRDKFMLIIEVENFNHDFPLKNDFSSKTFAQLAPHSLSNLLKAELEGTLTALGENKRPYTVIKLNQISPIEMAKTIFNLETLTVLLGHFFNLNPLNQPGVEAGKRYAYKWLESNITKK